MDYEKKYNDALKRAKAVMDVAANQDEARGIATTIFPELRESEDEKMMNQLHSWMMEFGGAEEYAERVFQWLKGLLEKQKEQKPADEQFPPLEGLDAIKAKYYDDGFKNGFDEGVESVKPAEWSKEDERMRNQLIYDIEYHKKEALISAKQNKATKALYDGIEKCYDEKIAWLKSLRHQPHWKPSKEQMNYLSAAVIEAQRRHNESTSGFPRYRVLKELYEQLLKL